MDLSSKSHPCNVVINVVRDGRAWLTGVLSIALAACGLHTYTPAALDQSLIPAAVADARLDDPDNATLLTQLAAVAVWPPAQWTPAQLGLLAVGRSRQVREAAAALDAAVAANAVVPQRSPRLSVGLEHHSLVDDNQSSEWSLGPAIEYTLSPVSRRRLLAARAKVAARQASIARVEAAWTARERAYFAALERLALDEQTPLMAAEGVARARTIAAARAEVAAGVADAFEWQSLRLDDNAVRLARLNTVATRVANAAALAAALDLPIEAVTDLVLATPGDNEPPAYPELQTMMLQRHPEILQALAAYEIAELDLALAIAAQYPAVTLNPGYFFDQGDHVWSLVGGVVVPLFANHDARIASAEAARTAARERFYATQSTRIGALQVAHARWRASRETGREADAIAADVRRTYRDLAARQAEGIVDRLSVARAAQQIAEIDLRLAGCRAETRLALSALESAARLPLADAPFARYLAELADAGSAHSAAP